MKLPGFSKNTSLETRMKEYESITDYSLIPRLPVYVRLDGRAFHTFCKCLEKPFDKDFVKTIKQVAMYLHEKTNAMLSYCQSDEISLVYDSPEKMPFGGRLFKIESVLAGMASSAFVIFGTQDDKREFFRERIKKFFPHVDCRCCQFPNLQEVANMFLWREQDSMKNSITLLALEHFTTKQLDKKNGPDKIAMLKEIGIDYWKAIPEDLRNGAYFHRELYDKEISENELTHIAKKNLPAKSPDGKYYVTRSHVVQFYPGMSLGEMKNKEDVLFNGAKAIKKDLSNVNN